VCVCVCVGGNKKEAASQRATTSLSFLRVARAWLVFGELVSHFNSDSVRSAKWQQREHEMCNELWQPQRFIEARPGLLTKLLNKRPTAMDSKCIAFWSTPTATATLNSNSNNYWKQPKTTQKKQRTTNEQSEQRWIIAKRVSFEFRLMAATVWGKFWTRVWSGESTSFPPSPARRYILFNCIRGWCRHKAHSS